MLTASVLAVVVLAAVKAPTADAECTNAPLRKQQSSTYLPDCRAYEFVTPAAKGLAEPETTATAGASQQEIAATVAAARGDRLAWDSEYSLPDSVSVGLDYLSTRTPEGWFSENVIPPQSPENGLACPTLETMVTWSGELSKGVLADGDAQEAGAQPFFDQGFECGHDEPRLVQGEPEGFQNLFVRGNTSPPSYQLVNITPLDAPIPTPKGKLQNYFPASFLAGSETLSQIVFEEELPLTEEAEGISPEVEAACKQTPKGRGCWESHDGLYEWSEGQQPAVRLVSILPDGRPVQGALAGATRNFATSGSSAPGEVQGPNAANFRHAVSAEGSRIFFEANGDLYVRENGGQAQSALGLQGKCAEPEQACTIQLDLSQGGSGLGGGGKWLAASRDGTQIFFTDEASAGLTANTKTSSGINLYEYELPTEADKPGMLTDLTPVTDARVLGLAGASEDGSYVYFVAEGALTGNQQNNQGVMAQAGQPNLYLLHESAVTFIATLAAADSCDWTERGTCENGFGDGPTARVSADGSFIAFNSIDPLTMYDNTDFVTSEADKEIYLYEQAANSLVCVSCNPAGRPVAGGAFIHGPSTAFGATTSVHPHNVISNAGQVFFETDEALLAQDTNGVGDVYEYEAGRTNLISSGVSEAPSFLVDATPSGSDVFIATAQPLLLRDIDTVYDIYDARVEGGFVESPPPAPLCESEACKRAAEFGPVFPVTSSATLTGPGNTSHKRLKARRLVASGNAKRLERALKECKRLYRHRRHKLIVCTRHAKKRYAPPRRDLKGSTKRGGR